MASFIDLNSEYRDREEHPNPFEYQLNPKQVANWFNFPRTTRAYAQNPGIQSLAFVFSVTLKSLTLPYSEQLAPEPRVYVNFRSTDTTIRNINLVQTIDNKLPEATFVCPFAFIQNVGDQRTWIHYKADIMQQNMRFKQGFPISFTVTLRDGTPVTGFDTAVPSPPDPMAQTFATFEILPYIKNAAIDNHLVDSFTPQ